MGCSNNLIRIQVRVGKHWEDIHKRVDPALFLLPKGQVNKVLKEQAMELDPSFLGFTNVYLALATLIPRHWTVVDLGCAQAAGCCFFKKHKQYIGVDPGKDTRFHFKNTKHFVGTIDQFLRDPISDLNFKETFGICSYVPDDDARYLVNETFDNVFNYYPHGGDMGLLPSFK